jgi:hypothetical protein
VSKPLIAHPCSKTTFSLFHPHHPFAALCCCLVRNVSSPAGGGCATLRANPRHHVYLPLQFDCHHAFVKKSTSSRSLQAELSFRRQSKPKAGKALQIVAMPSLSLEATLYLFHHIVLPPKLPQADDWKVEYEDALLDTTVEALRTFGEAVRNEQPQVARYARRSRSF